MSEEQAQEQQSQPTPADAGEGNNTSSLSIIERADNIVKRLEETEKRIDEKTRQYEQLLTRNLMSGRAVVAVPEKKEETAAEYAKRILRGGK